jgi:hypothetical protein
MLTAAGAVMGDMGKLQAETATSRTNKTRQSFVRMINQLLGQVSRIPWNLRVSAHGLLTVPDMGKAAWVLKYCCLLASPSEAGCWSK